MNQFKPKGTIAIMLLLLLLILFVWLGMYFGIFLKNQEIGGIIP